MQQSGSSLCRFGRGKSTVYALPREIEGVGSSAPLFRIGDSGRPQRLGRLHFLSEDIQWFERESGGGRAFRGLPWFLEDMRMQGFIGMGFPARHPDLKLPGRVRDWHDDHHLSALALRGEDCVGDLILGEESLNRFLAKPTVSYPRAEYPGLASGAIAGQPGSSAGGEHPKFAVYSEGRHVIVKFAGNDGAAALRWRDLLVAEHHALQLLGESGYPSARSQWFDQGDYRFLEVERFDRSGLQGRKGVVSLHAINCHILGGDFDSWSRACRRILGEPMLKLSADAAERIARIDTFGDLIGNTDRHFGNLSFFVEGLEELSLSPAPMYDMLPMVFAPKEGILVEREFAPRAPSASNFEYWHEAAALARVYWQRLFDAPGLSEGFRSVCERCRLTLERMITGRE
jgi:hypothetical protein